MLQQIDFVVPRGALAVILGNSGSGKTTLLRGIMQEACLVSGKVAVHGKLAIVSQPAWLQATTIR